MLRQTGRRRLLPLMLELSSSSHIIFARGEPAKVLRGRPRDDNDYFYGMFSSRYNTYTKIILTQTTARGGKTNRSL